MDEVWRVLIYLDVISPVVMGTVFIAYIAREKIRKTRIKNRKRRDFDF